MAWLKAFADFVRPGQAQAGGDADADILALGLRGLTEQAVIKDIAEEPTERPGLSGAIIDSDGFKINIAAAVRPAFSGARRVRIGQV